MKTLDNIMIHGTSGTTEQQMYFYNELKKAAVEWIKEIKKASEENWNNADEHDYCPSSICVGDLTLGDDYEDTEKDGAILFIQHFFNITDKDLEVKL